MKKVLSIILLVFIIALPLSATDKIHDDFCDTNGGSAFHSYGLMTYGFHSNTFHLRDFFFRYNYNLPDLQFFATVNGYKDTHDPDTNYQYMLNNINLYDYGASYKFLNFIYLSVRGAAVYRMNYDTYLLIPPYSTPGNPTQFDSPEQYIPKYMNAPGIRVGFVSDNFEVGYSQGDYRHYIPSAVMARFTNQAFYIKSVFQFNHADPLVYNADHFDTAAQISLGSESHFGDVTIYGIAEMTKINGLPDTNWQDAQRTYFRFEEAVGYSGFVFGIRQMIEYDKPTIFEFSIKKTFYSMVSLGFFYGTDGHAYAGTEVNF